ncbi:MAG TPA: ABC transporter substrate-binding protein [Dongiaceae bacterium]|nr:ABC transporter substrate-binding protein [Dongiaceae bacterium]
MKTMLAVFLGAAMLVQAAGAMAEPDVEKPNITIASATTGTFVGYPLALADKLGYFTDEGLKPQIAHFAGGTKAVEALLANSVDFNVGLYEYTIRLQAKGQHLVAVLNQILYPGFAVGVRTELADKVHALKDLKGLKVGVTAPGSGTQTMVTYLASREGVNADEISYVPVGSGGSALAALQHGEIDAISNLDPLMTMAERQNVIKIIADFRNKSGTESYFGGSAGSLGLVATAETIQKYPHTVQATVNALLRAMLWIRTHTPQELASTLPEGYGQQDMELWLASYKNVIDSLSPDGLMSQEAAKNTYDYLAAATPSLKSANIDLTKTFDNSFVQSSPVEKQLQAVK